MSVKEAEVLKQAEHHTHEEDGILGEQFETMEQQNNAYLIGMWAFIVQEVLFFGAIFAAYSVYRFKYIHEFTIAHHELNVPLGTLNTFFLLLSSYTMARAVRSAMKNQHAKQIRYLLLTFLLAGGFMVNKYFEYSAKFEHHLFPGGAYDAHEVVKHAEKSGDLKILPDGNFQLPSNKVITPEEFEQRTRLFFGFYFVMTGLHGLHVLIGMIIIAALIVRAYMDHIKKKAVADFMPVEMTGLYWHLVDIVWIFLFPLLYLIGR
ncbi:MAG: cytochrome c oxidase subunit 3 [Fimbriimonadales bacterium]